ncbi:MAG: C45 family autoproteolytic acyltransferase/hydrolase [Anaerolineaceae bacterium]
MKPVETLKTTSTHVVLEGTAYETGVSQAKMVNQIPGLKAFFEEGRKFPGRAGLEETMRIVRRFNLSLEEEITGFCDTLKISPADLNYFVYTHLRPHHCSHLLALPEITTDGHALVGRNYDFGHTMDDLRLCTTRVTGKHAHIGFSSIFFGRHDGINEHGLAVTASVGGMPVGLLPQFTPPQANGLQFWAILRAMLEECKTAAEAADLFKEMPGSGNPILLIADASGAAVIAEGFGAHKSAQPVENGWAAATNHFTAPEMQPFNQRLMNNSFVRAASIGNYLEENRGRVDVDGIKRMLGTPYPQGLACHYYQEFFGLLHSMVFDLTARSVEITFGSPAVNPWRTFTFEKPEPGQYETILPMEKADQQFWAAPAD